MTLARTTLRPIGAGLALSVVLFAPSSAALERLARIAPENGTWIAGATCSDAYYNLCTGWAWQWTLLDGDEIGVVFDSCDDACVLDTSQTFFFGQSPQGRGFTGTIAVHTADANDCPEGAPLYSQPFLPSDGWNLVNWGGVALPDRFVLMVTTATDGGFPTPSTIATDHPDAGPTGPPACGTCYPTTRENRSYQWNRFDQVLCPGDPFADPVCNAQLLMSVQLSCASGLDDANWGRVKGLYR